MSFIEIFERFPRQVACIEFLEGIRYKEGAYCPLCGSVDVAKKQEKNHKGRWNHHDCKSSFKAVRGTMFHGTKILLQKWFLGIVLIANAKKSLSSHQFARDLKLNQKTAWYLMQRIWIEMVKKENSGLLEGFWRLMRVYRGQAQIAEYTRFWCQCAEVTNRRKFGETQHYHGSGKAGRRG